MLGKTFVGLVLLQVGLHCIHISVENPNLKVYLKPNPNLKVNTKYPKQPSKCECINYFVLSVLFCFCQPEISFVLERQGKEGMAFLIIIILM